MSIVDVKEHEKYVDKLNENLEILKISRADLTPVFGALYPFNSRELSMVLTKLDESILWLQENIRKI